MANNPLWYNDPLNAALAKANGGSIQIYTGAQPALNAALTGTKLVSLPMSATAFAAAVNGVATANAITTENALASGTAGYYAMVESDGVTVVQTGTVGTSGADLNLSSLSITAGTPVSVASMTVTG